MALNFPKYDFTDVSLNYVTVYETDKDMYNALLAVGGICPGRTVNDILKTSDRLMTGISIDPVNSARYKENVKKLYLLLYPVVNGVTIDVDNPSTLEYGFSETSFVGNETDFPFDYSQVFEAGDTSVSIPYAVATLGTYLGFKVPTGTVIFNYYWYSPTNYGNIPNTVWNAPVTISGFDYYLSNVPLFLNVDFSTITFSRNV
jgi:hypothetical protein